MAHAVMTKDTSREAAEQALAEVVDALPHLKLTGAELDGLGADAFAIDWDEYEFFLPVLGLHLQVLDAILANPAHRKALLAVLLPVEKFRSLTNEEVAAMHIGEGIWTFTDSELRAELAAHHCSSEELVAALRAELGIHSDDDSRYDFGDLGPLSRPSEMAEKLLRRLTEGSGT